MPGFGFEDDELQKLFAEAGEAVKKAKVTPPTETPRPTPPPAPAAPPPVAAAPPPAPVAPPAAPTPPPPAPMAAAPEEEEFTVPTPPKPAPAPVAAGGEVRLVGGEQTDAALTARTQAGSTVSIPWAQMKNLSLGRVVDRNVLAFTHGGTLYFFNDENVAYKGLLKQMAATLTMNWRTLVQEIAAHVSDKSDTGILAVTGAGGMVPKYLDLGGFFNTVRSK